jgi:zona occludens toxin (predicted ATPase)
VGIKQGGIAVSITLITGIPGGGKTYWMVYSLLLKGLQDKYVIYHNIEGLKREFVDEEYVKDWRDFVDEEAPGDFFSKRVQVELCRQVKEKYGRPVLMIIDEAGKDCLLGKENPDYYAWLSWHRHEGQDIWIGVQDAGKIARAYRKLNEMEVRGVKGSVITQFVYSYKVAKTEIRVERLPKKEAVFRAYDSFNIPGASKKSSKLIPSAIGMIVFAMAIMIYVISYALPRAFPQTKKVVPITTAKEKPKPKPVKVVKKEKAALVMFGGPDLSAYTFAGIVGGRVLLQSHDGTVHSAEDIVGWVRVLESDGRCVTLYTRVEGVGRICRKNGFVKVKEGRGAGAGGATSPAPLPSMLGEG